MEPLMHEFRDTKGRPWQLEVNVDTIEQVKIDCGINLLDVADPSSNLMQELIAFPPLLAKLLFSSMADQAKTKEVDDREFRRSMNGDTLQAAHDALIDEIILFSPKHRQSLLQAVRDKNREVEEAGTNLALARLADPALQKQALEAMDRKLRLQIEEALENLGPTAKHSAITSLINVGSPPDSSDSQAQDFTPGDGSSDSPPEPGDPTVG
jgi:hypothetical protein